MPQFMLYENKNPATKKLYPFLLDIQPNLLDELRTTVVIPLCSQTTLDKRPITKLCPVFTINQKSYVALTQQLAGIDRRALGKEICSLAAYRSEIISAVDFILSGV
jgi:toxin CcdB